MPDPKRILSEFRRAISFYGKSEIVDLDLAFFEKFDFLALRLEDVFRINRTVPPNRWSFHRIGMITQGTGEFHTGVYKIPARKFTLVVVPARVMTGSRNWSSDVKGLLLLFNSHFFVRHSYPFKLVLGKKILSPYTKPFVYLDEEKARHITAVFESLLKEQSQPMYHSDELISLKVLELI